MAIISDYHMHSSFSGDSRAPMEEMIQKAISLGLKQICFTEHQDFDYVYEEENPEEYFEINTDSYLYELLQLKEKYANQIDVFFGVELGMQTHLARKNAAYVKNHEFDFVIASSHLCNGQDPYNPSFFEGKTEEESYREYFNYMYDCIYGFRNFDVYGHLDYILRYGPNKNRNFRYEIYQTEIDRILKLLIDNEKGIEVNSSGLSYGLGQTHPCREILMRYKELGGEIITIGSDAHTPERIASDFDKVRELLIECGFTQYCVFHGRLPEYLPL